MATREMTCSRAVPVPPEAAFAQTLTIALPSIFDRWYGPLAPVAEVRGQDGVWGTVGQTRTIVQARGAGSFLETLTDVDAPRSFSYRLTHATGPVARLVSTADGRWSFAPAGTGTEITWLWRVQPASSVAGALMPGVAKAWQGFARQSLERLSQRLLDDVPPR